MIQIDNITIIAASLLVILAVVTPLVNVFFRKPDIAGTAATDVVEADTATSLPPVSIVMMAHGNPEELERNLPLFLSLDYSPGFEVIVVAWKGDLDTEDVLKRYADNPHLYTTFIPASSRYMSRKKLAVTLGVKAAKNEWIILTEPECAPRSEKWLQIMARNCSETVDMVVGYTAYAETTPGYRCFERLNTELYLMRETLRGHAYRTESNNLMFRKSMFLGGDGYRGNLKYLRGEYDFMVNKYARKDNVVLELDADGWTIEQEPTDKEWRNKHLFHIENRKHLLRSASCRVLYNVDQTLMHVNYLLILIAISWSLPTGRWILTGVAVAALIYTIVARTVIAGKKLRTFEIEISPMLIVPYEISMVWHRLGYMLKYMKADKTDFISHKI